MLSIDDYIDAARKHTRATSDRHLSTMMNKNLSVVGTYRTGRAWPEPETMIELARLGKMDEQLAILYLGWWRALSKNQHLAATLYLNMIEDYEKQAA